MRLCWRLSPSTAWWSCRCGWVGLLGRGSALVPHRSLLCLLCPQGSLTRGMSVFQEPGGEAALPANVLLVTDICMQRFQALMDAATD